MVASATWIADYMGSVICADEIIHQCLNEMAESAGKIQVLRRQQTTTAFAEPDSFMKLGALIYYKGIWTLVYIMRM